MIIALEIGAALSLVAMLTVYVSSLPKPKRVRVRAVRDGQRQR
ncbi:hypothetical protein BH09PSE1_BH09PSE1_10740 [soil metagenome]